MSINCNFCGKSSYAVEIVIANDGCSHICGECVDLCNKIIKEYREKKEGNESNIKDLDDTGV